MPNLVFYIDSVYCLFPWNCVYLGPHRSINKGTQRDTSQKFSQDHLKKHSRTISKKCYKRTLVLSSDSNCCLFLWNSVWLSSTPLSTKVLKGAHPRVICRSPYINFINCNKILTLYSPPIPSFNTRNRMFLQL